METIAAIAAAAGIPSTIIGLIVWRLQKKIEKRDAMLEEREKNREKLMEMILKSSSATCVLATATAKAVQRIPEAHCNGDMTAALEEARKYQSDEHNFIVEQGVRNII